LRELAEKNGHYALRVFWGFDNSEMVNRIRFVIMPVDEYGNLIIIHHHGGAEAVNCLDRDWP